MMVVLLLETSLIASIIALSVLESKAEVASSKIMIGQSLSSARAIPTLCRSPPLSLTPLSPTGVFNPSGRAWMNLVNCAFSHALATRVIV